MKIFKGLRRGNLFPELIYAENGEEAEKEMERRSPADLFSLFEISEEEAERIKEEKYCNNVMN